MSHDLEDVGGVAVFPQTRDLAAALLRIVGDERVLVFDGEQRS